LGVRRQIIFRDREIFRDFSRIRGCQTCRMPLEAGLLLFLQGKLISND